MFLGLGMLLFAAAGPPAVGVQLISDTAALAAGRTTDVGVVLTLPEGWHTYWDGLNDSGFPPRLVWDLPAGITAGEPAWPAPHRHVAPGEILDHVLDGEVIAVVPVTVPADFRAAGGVALRCRVEWLACRDVCVPGRSDASRTLAVVAAGEAPADRDGRRQLAAARSALPRPLPDPPPVRWSREGNILTIVAPGARHLVLMPRRDSARPVDLLRQGEADGDGLRLDLRPEDAGRPVVGVLAVHAADATITAWQLDIPAEEQP